MLALRGQEPTGYLCDRDDCRLSVGESRTLGDRERSIELRAILLITIVLWVGSFAEFAWPSIKAGWGIASTRRQIALLGMGGVSIVGIGLLLAIFFSNGAASLATIAAIGERLKPNRVPAFVLWLVSLAILPVVIMGPAGRFFEGLTMRLGMFWVLTWIGAWLSLAVRPGGRVLARIPTAAVLLGAFYQFATYLAGISSYPFTLGWSEASRYYYASLFLSQSIYGIQAAPSVLHPSRYLMQAVPFLIPNSPIWLHRLWQVVLWIGTSAGSGYLLARRLGIPRRHMRWIFVTWAGLFLLQGPVYYHLLVSVILVVWGFDPKRFWRSMIVVLAASVWAGISRINWIPVPGLLAVTLYLLETPTDASPWWRYGLRPALWVCVGGLVGLAAQATYIALSGNAASDFGSSFFSELLWYRLFPSQTFPLGILPATILASLPLAIVIYRYLARRPGSIDSIRILGVGAALGVLLGGGLVVSVKIGGGSNLHNLDAYVSLLLLVAAYAYFGRVEADHGDPSPTTSPAWLNALIGLIPMLFILGTGAPIESHDPTQTMTALDTIQARTAAAVQSGKDVLFVSERQLLTFGDVSGVRLVPGYETVFLMEMAMSRNRPYLDAFHRDLREQRYSMIVVHDLETSLQGSGHSFGEENDAWVEEVSEPILCSYEPTVVIPHLSLQMLTPRAAAGSCP